MSSRSPGSNDPCTRVSRVLGFAPAPAFRRGEVAARRAAKLRRVTEHVDAMRQLAVAQGDGALAVLTFPAALDREARAALHTEAEALGLVHESSGYGQQRHLRVSRPLEF